MEKGGVIVFLIVVICIAWVFNKSSNYTGQATLNTPTATEQPKPAASNFAEIAKTVASIKPIATGQIKDKKGNVIGLRVTSEDVDRASKARLLAARPLYAAAAAKHGLPDPALLASTHWNEARPRMCAGAPHEVCDDSSAQCKGPMQFADGTWKLVACDADGDGVADVHSLADSVFGAAALYQRNGGDTDKAIFAYNHSNDYVKSIRNDQRWIHELFAQNPSSQPVAMADGNGPTVATLANTASPAGAGVTHAVEGPPRTHLFASNPLKGFIKWFSAYANHRADGDRVYPHAGIDAGCLQRGQPVLSVCDGKVETSAELPDGRAGLTVIVACSDGMHKTSAMHLDTSVVSKGTSVRAGQEVGACGTTGNAERGKSGPHVHFKLERLIAGVWTIVSPCAGMPNETVLDCGAMWGPNTDFAPLSTIVASN